MAVLDRTHRHSITLPFYRLFFEVFVFALLALFFGITLAFLFPDNTDDESLGVAIGWWIAEVLLNASIIYLFDKVYFLLFGIDSDTYIGISIFSVVLFSTQVQMQNRARLIYNKVTGYHPPSVR